MAKIQKQPAKTCADCIHETACRVWTDGRAISDASASQCPSHETVKESGAYLCGVLDERKRKQTNADRIRSMSDDELAAFLCNLRSEKARDGCLSCVAEGFCRIGHTGMIDWLQQPAEGE